MYQLGAEDGGRISYDDFVRRRRELSNEYKAHCLTRSSTEDDEFWPLEMLDSAQFGDACEPLAGEEFFASAEQTRQLMLSSTHEVGSGSEDEAAAKLLWPGSAKGSDSVASHSMEASSSAKHASSLWEFDSGAHDLINDLSDQMSIHRMIESQGIPVPPNCIELLEIANNVSDLL